MVDVLKMQQMKARETAPQTSALKILADIFFSFNQCSMLNEMHIKKVITT